MQQITSELENPVGPRGLRTMTSPGLQIHLWSCVALTFDLLNPKLIISCPVTSCANQHPDRFISFQNIVFTSLVKDDQTKKWTG